MLDLTYTLKKATRHYCDELQSLFEKGFDDAEGSEKYSTEILATGSESKNLKRKISEVLDKRLLDFTQWAAFFVQWNDSTTAEKLGLTEELNSLFLAVNVEIRNIEHGSGKEAQLTWVSYHKKSLDRALGQDPRLFHKLLQQIEGWAASQGCSRFFADVSQWSVFAGNIPPNRGYQVVRQMVAEGGDVLLRFATTLPPAFSGDPANWNELSDWYTRFAYSTRTPPPEVKEEPEERKGFKFTDFVLPAGNCAFNEILAQTQRQIVIRILVAQDKFDEEAALSVLRDNNENRINLTLVPDNADETSVSALRKVSDIVKRSEIRKDLEQVFYYYKQPDQSRHNESLWSRRFNLQACDVSDRKAVIVEIDRESYIDLTRRLIAETLTDKLVFFNHMATEKINPGTPIYFYVWDGDPGEDVTPNINGVIAARGIIVEEPRILNQSEITEVWDEIGKYTIWPDKFTQEYFEDRFVALSVRDLCLFIPSDIYSNRRKEFLGSKREQNDRSWFENFDGITHLELTRLILRSEKMEPEEVLRYYPNWEVGNTFVRTKAIERRLFALLKEKLEDQLYQFLSTDDGGSTSHQIDNGTSNQMSLLQKAEYYIGNYNSEATRDDSGRKYLITLIFAETPEDRQVVELFKEGLEDAAKKLECRNSIDIHEYSDEHAGYSDNYHKKLFKKIWGASIVVPFFSHNFFNDKRKIIRDFELPIMVQGLREERFEVRPVMVSTVDWKLMQVTWDGKTKDLEEIETDMRRASPGTEKIGRSVGRDAINPFKNQLYLRYTRYAEDFLNTLFE